MKKFLMLIGVLFLVFCGFLIYDGFVTLKIPVLDIEEEKVVINKLYIYGTHLNMEGNYTFTEEAELVLYNGNFITYRLNASNGEFNLSEYINDGIYLDNIPKGKYYLFLRTKYIENEEVKYKYYSLSNNTNYKDTTYYTMSNYTNKIVITNEYSYPTMMMKVEKVKNDEVYDIVIDPGHGGIDGGASKNGYKETDFTLKIAHKLKEQLEEKGFKVKLTHEIGQLSNNERLEEYGVHGRAVIPREVNAKYLFSIHLNSSAYASVSGLEIYTAKNINYDFAKLLVKNITTSTGLGYSNNKINKVENSIYSRNFTELDVEDSIKDYKNGDLTPYDITTNSNYYYIIRETGGIITGAYVDDRNDEIVGNPYTLSNVGTETYLLELGYISNINDLNNIISNLDKYVYGITTSIGTLYNNN